jgi:hypothetical protein
MNRTIEKTIIFAGPRAAHGSIGTNVAARRFGLWANTPSNLEDYPMKRALIAGALVAVLAGSAYAQTATITFEPAQRTKIKEYVVKERVAPARIQQQVTVGATIPADVELRSVPADWGPTVSRYRYFYSDNNVYFVDPADRRVVTVID